MKQTIRKNTVQLKAITPHPSRLLRQGGPLWGRSQAIAQLISTVQALCTQVRTAAHTSVPRVAVSDGRDLLVFDAREVSRFYAAGKYTGFSKEGGEHLASATLRELEDRLLAHGFMRVHRGELVNLNHVVRLKRVGDGGLLIMRDGQEAPVSRQYYQELRDQLLGGKQMS